MAQLEIHKLTYTYPTAPEHPALDGIELAIQAGEYITLCGRSGSGKTTLLRHLKNVLTPHGERTGEVLFNGVPLAELSVGEQASRIGYVMQNPDSQIVTDKVWHELAFGLENLGVDQQTIRLRVAEMASYFGMQGWFHRDVAELSGGQKQLLNLASVMVMHPDVLILDEPTSQLDPIAASDFLNTVRKINLELGTTILITEHRLEDILHASDRVIVLEDGKITADASPAKLGRILYEAEADLFTAMPAPVQIYYGVRSGLKVCPEANCPLTVREGRTWMDALLKEQGMRDPVSKSHEVRATGASCSQVRETIDWGAQPLAIEMRDVWFRYDRKSPDVLRGMDLEVPKGSVFAIVGGNGTGKSTALKCICRVTRPWRGTILIDGKRVEKYSNAELFRGNLCMLPQDPQSLFVMKTVQEELEEMTESGQDRKDRILQMAELCGIAHLLERHPYDLSGGEQQRAALAKVLMTSPKILLLDEPTKGMDTFFKKQFGSLLRKLAGQGTTIVIVSHDVEFCARYADLAAMCFDGGITSSNTIHKFFGGNSFYTTAANRMARHKFPDAVTEEDVIRKLRENV